MLVDWLDASAAARATMRPSAVQSCGHAAPSPSNFLSRVCCVWRLFTRQIEVFSSYAMLQAVIAVGLCSAAGLAADAARYPAHLGLCAQPVRRCVARSHCRRVTGVHCLTCRTASFDHAIMEENIEGLVEELVALISLYVTAATDLRLITVSRSVREGLVPRRFEVSRSQPDFHAHCMSFALTDCQTPLEDELLPALQGLLGDDGRAASMASAQSTPALKG